MSSDQYRTQGSCASTKEPVEPASGIDIDEAETKEDEAAELELGEVVESVEKTTAGRKSRKSGKEDAVGVDV